MMAICILELTATDVYALLDTCAFIHICCVCARVFHWFFVFYFISFELAFIDFPWSSSLKILIKNTVTIYFSAAILERRAKRCQRPGRTTFDCPLPSWWLSQTQCDVDLDIQRVIPRQIKKKKINKRRQNLKISKLKMSFLFFIFLNI
jgi:hypothetical protein